MNESLLLWALVFGSIGLGYAVYGRRQKNTPAFLAGLALMAVPYFVSSVFALVASGGVLMAIPFVIKT